MSNDSALAINDNGEEISAEEIAYHRGKNDARLELAKELDRRGKLTPELVDLLINVD